MWLQSALQLRQLREALACCMCEQPWRTTVKLGKCTLHESCLQILSMQ